MSLFTFLPYFGGKYYMLKKLYPLFPKHYMYIEPFCGSCVVLLNKKLSNVEVVNDRWEEIYNLFTVVKNKPEEFYDAFKYTFSSRVYFNRILNTDITKLNDIQRAHCFYYKMYHSYSTMWHSTSFRTSSIRKNALNYNKLKGIIDRTYDRLKNVKIECLDYSELFKIYDEKNNFFFLDPPYYDESTSDGHKPEYVHNFTKEDFLTFAENLGNLKGKFLMTINDCSFIRETFKDFLQTKINHVYGTAKSVYGQVDVTELLISNYDLTPKRYPLKRGGVQCSSLKGLPSGISSP